MKRAVQRAIRRGVVLLTLGSIVFAQSLPAFADPMNGNLAGTARTETAGAGGVIMVGGHPVAVSAGAALTPAQAVALQQVLTTGAQSLTLNGAGAAIGGTFALGSGTALSSLMLPAGVTGIANFSGGAPLAVAGNLVNSGTLYAVSTNAAVVNATINALNILNSAKALMTTVLPVGGLSGYAGAIGNLGLTLNATEAITNAGVISSAANLTLSAGQSIQNSGLLAAVQNVNLNAVNNNLLVNNNGGTITAGGAVNVNALGATTANTIGIYGGTISAPQFNIDASCAKVEVALHQLDGLITATAGSAHVGAFGGNMSLGNITISGDPTFYNSGDIVVSGNIVVDEALTIISGEDIDLGNYTLSTNGSGKDVTIVAGALILAGDNPQQSSPIGPFTTGGVNVGTPILPNQKVTVIGATNLGGSVTCNGCTIDTSVSAGAPGNIKIYANASGVGDEVHPGGTILLLGASKLDAHAGPGFKGGDVLLMTPFQIKFASVDVSASGVLANPESGGSVTAICAQPINSLIASPDGSVVNNFTPVLYPFGIVRVLQNGVIDARGGGNVSFTCGAFVAMEQGSSIDVSGRNLMSGRGENGGTFTINFRNTTDASFDLQGSIFANGSSADPMLAPGAPGGNGGVITAKAGNKTGGPFSDPPAINTISVNGGNGAAGLDGAPGTALSPKGGAGMNGGNGGNAGKIDFGKSGQYLFKGSTISLNGGNGGNAGDGGRGFDNPNGNGGAGGAGGNGGLAGKAGFLTWAGDGGVEVKDISAIGGNGGNAGAGGDGGTGGSLSSTGPAVAVGGAPGAPGIAAAGANGGILTFNPHFDPNFFGSIVLNGGNGGAGGAGGDGGSGHSGATAGAAGKIGGKGGDGGSVIATGLLINLPSNSITANGGNGGAGAAGGAGGANYLKAGAAGGAAAAGGAGGKGGTISLKGTSNINTLVTPGDIVFTVNGGDGGAMTSANGGAGGNGGTDGGNGGAGAIAGAGGNAGFVTISTTGGPTASTIGASPAISQITALGGDASVGASNGGAGGVAASFDATGAGKGGIGGKAGAGATGGAGGSVTVSVKNDLTLLVPVESAGGHGSKGGTGGLGGNIFATHAGTTGGKGGDGGVGGAAGKAGAITIKSTGGAVFLRDSVNGLSIDLTATSGDPGIGGDGGNGGTAGGGGSGGGGGAGGKGGDSQVGGTITVTSAKAKNIIYQGVMKANAFTVDETGDGGAGGAGQNSVANGTAAAVGGAGGKGGDGGKGANGGTITFNSGGTLQISADLNAPTSISIRGASGGYAGGGGDAGLSLNGMGMSGGNTGNGGIGGNGGIINATSAGALRFDSDVIGVGGTGGNIFSGPGRGGDGTTGGGAGGNGLLAGKGGVGGKLNLTTTGTAINISIASSATGINLAGGNPGEVDYNIGADGGSSTASGKGGAGGNAGTSGLGGQGGAVTIKATGDVVTDSASSGRYVVTLDGASGTSSVAPGGDGGNANADAGTTGGKGGNASISASGGQGGSFTVTTPGTFVFSSNSSIAASGGNGGYGPSSPSGVDGGDGGNGVKGGGAGGNAEILGNGGKGGAISITAKNVLSIANISANGGLGSSSGSGGGLIQGGAAGSLAANSQGQFATTAVGPAGGSGGAAGNGGDGGTLTLKATGTTSGGGGITLGPNISLKGGTGGSLDSGSNAGNGGDGSVLGGAGGTGGLAGKGGKGGTVTFSSAGKDTASAIARGASTDIIDISGGAGGNSPSQGGTAGAARIAGGRAGAGGTNGSGGGGGNAGILSATTVAGTVVLGQIDGFGGAGGTASGSAVAGLDALNTNGFGGTGGNAGSGGNGGKGAVITLKSTGGGAVVMDHALNAPGGAGGQALGSPGNGGAGTTGGGGGNGGNAGNAGSGGSGGAITISATGIGNVKLEDVDLRSGGGATGNSLNGGNGAAGGGSGGRGGNGGSAGNGGTLTVSAVNNTITLLKTIEADARLATSGGNGGTASAATATDGKTGGTGGAGGAGGSGGAGGIIKIGTSGTGNVTLQPGAVINANGSAGASGGIGRDGGTGGTKPGGNGGAGGAAGNGGNGGQITLSTTGSGTVNPIPTFPTPSFGGAGTAGTAGQGGTGTPNGKAGTPGKTGKAGAAGKLTISDASGEDDDEDTFLGRRKSRSGTSSSYRAVSYVVPTMMVADRLVEAENAVMAPTAGDQVACSELGCVRVAKGAVAFVVHDGARLVVMCLHTSRSGDVMVDAGGQKISLHAGQQLVLGADACDALSRVAVRNVHACDLGDRGIASMSEFSLPSAVANLHALRALANSDRATFGKILKTAAALQTVTMAKGAYTAR